MHKPITLLNFDPNLPSNVYFNTLHSPYELEISNKSINDWFRKKL